MLEWRLILGGGTSPVADDSYPTLDLESDGARNMAVDQVLFDVVKAGAAPALRLYRWMPACLSLGRNQPALGRYDAEARVPGRDIVRRPTGGLAVFHDQELTYSVTCPVGALGSPRAIYLRVHTALARGLASLGVPAVVSGREESTTPLPSDPLGVCFHSSAEGEILAAAGKLVGSAQRTEARTILQHGSIIIDGSQERAAAGQSPPRQSPAKAQSPTLKALLGRTPEGAELVDAIRTAFETELGIRLAPATLSDGELARLDEADARYRSADWTWRS
jgi:lipoate-protein ligase A